MEKHQIVRPRQTRGTPSRRVIVKLGILSSIATVVGFFISDYLRVERHEKRMQAGRFMLEEHIRWHNMLMGRLSLLDSVTTKTLQRRHTEETIVDMQEDSTIHPNMLDSY